MWRGHRERGREIYRHCNTVASLPPLLYVHNTEKSLSYIKIVREGERQGGERGSGEGHR